MAGKRSKGRKANAKMVNKPASNSNTSRSGKGFKQGNSVVGINSIGRKYKFTEVNHKRDALTGEFITKPGSSNKTKSVGKSFGAISKEVSKVNKGELKAKLQLKLQSLKVKTKDEDITIDVPGTKTKLVKAIKSKNEINDKVTGKDSKTNNKVSTNTNTKELNDKPQEINTGESQKNKKTAQDIRKERITGLIGIETDEGFLPSNSKLTQPKANQFEAALNSLSKDTLDRLITSGEMDATLRKSLDTTLNRYEDETERAVITQFLLSDQPTKTQQALAEKVRKKLLNGGTEKPLTDKQMISAKNTMIKHFEKGKLTGDKVDSLTLTEAIVKSDKAKSEKKKVEKQKTVAKKAIKERVKSLDKLVELEAKPEFKESLKVLRLLPAKETSTIVPIIEKEARRVEVEVLRDNESTTKRAEDAAKEEQKVNDVKPEKSLAERIAGIEAFISTLDDPEAIAMVRKLMTEGNNEVINYAILSGGKAEESLNTMRANDLKAKQIELLSDKSELKTKPQEVKSEDHDAQGRIRFRDSESSNKYIDKLVKDVEMTYADHKFSKLTGVEPRLIKLARMYGYSSEIQKGKRETSMGFADPQKRTINITPNGMKQTPEFVNSIMRHEIIHAIQGSTGLKESNFDSKGRYTARNITPLGIDATPYIKPSEAFNSLANYSPDKWAIELEAFTSNKAQFGGEDISAQTLATALYRDKKGLNKEGGYNTNKEWWNEVIREGKKQGKEAYTRSVIRNASEIYPDLKNLVDKNEVRLEGEKAYVPIDNLSQDEIKVVSKNTDVAKPKFIYDQELRDKARKFPDYMKKALTDLKFNIPPERIKLMEGIIDDFAAQGGIKSITKAINDPSFKLSDVMEVKSLLDMARTNIKATDIAKGGEEAKMDLILMVTDHNLDISMFHALNNMNEKQKEKAISTLSITPKTLSRSTNGILNFYL